MEPAAEAVARAAAGRDLIRPWHTPMVSSMTATMITTPAELVADFERNLVAEVRWMQTYQYLVDTLNVTKLVNLGPGPTLVALSHSIPTELPATLFEGSWGEVVPVPSRKKSPAVQPLPLAGLPVTETFA